MSLGIGTMTKRDCVMVKVTTEDGIVGWGESHHARAPGTIGHLVNTTLRGLVLGMDATDTVGIWARIYKMQLGSHGAGAATSMAMSGLDQALWDIKGKAVGWPLYKLLGGTNKPVPAYAGGISLGYQPPDALAAEAVPMVEAGYRALKLRVGDNVKADIARMTAVRRRFGDDIVLLTDANTGYSRGRRAPGHAGDGRAQHRLAGGAVPGARPSLLRAGARLRPHAAGGRREPLHALRVPSRDRGRRSSPSCSPISPRAAASPRCSASRRRPRCGSCRSIRIRR